MVVKEKNFYTNCQLSGNNLLYRGIKDGKRVCERIEYQPTLFLISNKESKYKTLKGENVEKICPGGILDTRDFLQRYKDVHDFKVYGNTNFQYCYIADLFPNEIEYDINDIIIANLDIETGSENGFPEPDLAAEVVTAITVKIKNTFHVFGCGKFVTTDENIKYNRFADEQSLLRGFVDFWTKVYPDVITGWNVSMFDVPYLVNRITKICGDYYAKKLSPWERYNKRQVTLMGKVHETFALTGISLLDYIELYKKYAPENHQESYKLDHIASVENVGRKLSFEEHGNLRNLYKNDYQKFIEYNIQDVNLVDKLDDKLKLIEMVLSFAYDSKSNYDDVFGQVRVWDNLIFNELKKTNVVLPPKVDGEKETSYSGAYVKDPICGLHKWVVSLDINSLYPSLINMFNISPEMLIESDAMNITVDELLKQSVDTSILKSENRTMTANGCYFKTQEMGFLAKMMKRMYQERKEYKNKMLESSQELERVKQEIQRRKTL